MSDPVSHAVDTFGKKCPGLGFEIEVSFEILLLEVSPYSAILVLVVVAAVVVDTVL